MNIFWYKIMNNEFQMQESLKSKKYLGAKVTYDEWKAFVKQDGWLCRDDKDCVWYDLSLGCDDREFNSTNVEVRVTT